MIEFIRWIYGFVKFSFKSGFAEGFLNDCYKSGLNVHNLQVNSEGLVGNCSITTYKKLHKIALKNGGIVKVEKKHGPIFQLLKIKNRWGLFVGMLVFIIAINYMNGFIWNIEIVGNNRISTQEITEFLEDNSLTLGANWKSIDKDKIENLIMASFDDCAWVHINQLGTTARIEFNETRKKPNLVDNSAYTNLKATKDGIIVKAYVKDGWRVAKVGDSVVKGDLLISGIYESELTKRNVFAHAYGDYIAQVKEPINITVSRQQTKKIYTKELNFNTLDFFFLHIPLYFGSSKYVNSDEIIEKKPIFVRNIPLPIGITTKTVKCYKTEKVLLNDKDLTKLINKELNNQILQKIEKDNIVSKKIDISLNSDEAVAKGSIICLENIGKEYKIYKKP